MAEQALRTGVSDRDLLRAFALTLNRGDRWEIALYVALSLAAAWAGSLAAVSLVPLIQPGQALPVVGRFVDVRNGASVQVSAAIFAGFAVAFALVRWQAARLGARVVSRYGVRLRQQVHARLIDAPLVSLADSTSAEIANVLTHNVEIAVQGISAMLQLLVAGLTCAVTLIVALWVSPPLVLAAPLIVGLGLGAVRFISREQSDVSRQYVADMTNLFWHSEDFPRRLRHVRSFEREEVEKASFGAASSRLRDGYRRQLELVASGRLALELLGTAGIAGIFLLAHYWHGIDQASIIAVCLLLGRLLPYLVSTRQSFQQLRSAGPALELWQRYMHLTAGECVTETAHAVSGAGELHIDHLRVTPPLSGLEIRDLLLVPGELTLVSGDSGIGKSNLIDVLAGMTSPQAFTAHLGGHAIGFDEYRDLVRNGAYVSQSVRPWQHSVRECLLWAAPGKSEDELRNVLDDVGLTAMLARSSRGLDTVLHSSSSRLSGGELQRLLLAQVILKQPRVALLDEATSALDSAAELAVLSVLRERLPKTIMIVVSHRQGVASLADQHIVIGNDGSAFAAGISHGRAAANKR